MKKLDRPIKTLALLGLLIFMNSCVSLYNSTRYVDSDYKHTQKSKTLKNHISATANDNSISITCASTKHVDYYTKEIKNYEYKRAKWLSDVDYDALTPLVIIPVIAIDIVNPIPLLGFETSSYTRKGRTKKTESKTVTEPLVREKVHLINRNNNITLDSKTIYTNSKGVAHTNYYVGKTLITQEHPYWNNSLFSNVSPDFLNLYVKTSIGNKTIKLGPFKDVNEVIDRAVDIYSNRIINRHFTNLTLNILDKNTHRPVSYADVKLKLERQDITEMKIKSLVSKEVDSKFPLETNWIKNAIINKTFSEINRKVNYRNKLTTNSSGKVNILLLKKKYSIEFLHDYYNWNKHRFNLNKSTLDYNVYMTDVGSKIRVERVQEASKGDLIERN